MMRRFATLALTIASLASPLAAQSHPNFAGTWALNPKASEGPMMPSSMIMVITQDAKAFKVDNTTTMAMGEQKMEQKSAMAYNLDGSTAKNTLSNMGQSLELTSKVSWDGPALLINTEGELAPGRALLQKDRWTLAPDGKTLTIAREGAASRQSFSVKLVFVKQ